MENKMVLLAIFIALLSIFFLYLFLDLTKPIEISLYSTSINKIPKNTLIEFYGTIESMNFGENSASIRVCDKNCVTVIANRNLKVINILTKNDFIKVKGTAKTYYNSVIIYANEITHIK